MDAPLVGGMFVSGTGFGPGVRRDAVARAMADESASAVAGDMEALVGRRVSGARKRIWCATARVGRFRLAGSGAPGSSGPFWPG